MDILGNRFYAYSLKNTTLKFEVSILVPIYVLTPDEGGVIYNRLSIMYNVRAERQDQIPMEL